MTKDSNVVLMALGIIAALAAVAWGKIPKEDVETPSPELPPAPPTPSLQDTPQTSGGTMGLAEFIAKLQPIAEGVAEAQEWPIPDSSDMIILQAVHESGAQRVPQGASVLATKYNNLFGITAELGTWWRSQSKPFVEMPTTEWDSSNKSYQTTRPFRSYATWEECVLDWTRMMNTLSVYRKAKSGLQSGDLNLFLAGLKEAGYATDQNYAGKLAALYQTVKEHTA